MVLTTGISISQPSIQEPCIINYQLIDIFIYIYIINTYTQLRSQMSSRTTAYLHRFLREPNHAVTRYSRLGDRSTPFQNTLTVLKDPKNNRELYLVGTTNSSTLLAHRTRKLVNEVKPTSVFVQTTPEWWNHARHVQVDNQPTFSQVSLPSPKLTMENHFRGLFFKAKYYTWMATLRYLADLPTDFNLLTPGLEVKYALQEAEKAGSNILFHGYELNRQTLEGLQNSTKFYFTNLLRNTNKVMNGGTLQDEYDTFQKILHVRGGEAFAESLDRFRANFMVHLLNRIAPEQKKVLIDDKDEDIFYQLYRDCPGDKIVAVVNQLHVTGVEGRWRRATGTELEEEQTSPIADMDIDSFQERHLINEYLRERASKLTKSEPATGWDYIVQYHKENFEYERTRHTHHTSHKDIPEPGEEHNHNHKHH